MIGTVQKVIYRVESYVIATVHLDEIPKDISNKINSTKLTIKGNIVGLERGKRYDFSGKLVKNTWKTKSGEKAEQVYEVTSFKELEPDTREGIVNYLLAFDGVDKNLAESFYELWGKETLQTLFSGEVSDEDVLKCPKLTLQILKKLRTQYKNIQNHIRLVELLSPYEIKLKNLKRFIEDYGVHVDFVLSLEIDESHPLRWGNPYILMNYGLSFSACDEFALSLGIPAIDERRIWAAAYKALFDIAGQGHCFEYSNRLYENTRNILKRNTTDENIANYAIEVIMNLVRKDPAFRVQDDRVYLTKLYNAEIDIAHRIKNLLAFKQESVDAEDVIEAVEKSSGIKYSPNQREAVKLPLKYGFSIVTGGPGTGKTTMLKAMIAVIQQAYPGAQILCCSPTGRAAKRMQESSGYPASTIHRALEYHPKTDAEKFIKETKNLKEDFIIVDEASMMDVELCSILLKSCKNEATVVLIGDAEQLAPIAPGRVFSDIIDWTIIESSINDSKVVPVVKLDHIYRQSERSNIVFAASNILAGNPITIDGKEVCLIKSRFGTDIPQIVVSLVKTISAKDGLEAVKVLTPYRTKKYESDSSVESLNELIQNEVNPSKRGREEYSLFYGNSRICFRVNDPVMQTANNYDLNVFNGDVGVINKIKDFEITVNYDGVEVVYSHDDVKELTLNYASTIHKAQGSEYQCVIIVISPEHEKMLTKRLVYTALTRARKKVIFVGDENLLKPNSWIFSKKDSRNTSLKERLHTRD